MSDIHDKVNKQFEHLIHNAEARAYVLGQLRAAETMQTALSDLRAKVDLLTTQSKSHAGKSTLFWYATIIVAAVAALAFAGFLRMQKAIKETAALHKKAYSYLEIAHIPMDSTDTITERIKNLFKAIGEKAGESSTDDQVSQLIECVNQVGRREFKSYESGSKKQIVDSLISLLVKPTTQTSDMTLRETRQRPIRVAAISALCSLASLPPARAATLSSLTRILKERASYDEIDGAAWSLRALARGTVAELSDEVIHEAITELITVAFPENIGSDGDRELARVGGESLAEILSSPVYDQVVWDSGDMQLLRGVISQFLSSQYSVEHQVRAANLLVALLTQEMKVQRVLEWRSEIRQLLTSNVPVLMSTQKRVARIVALGHQPELLLQLAHQSPEIIRSFPEALEEAQALMLRRTNDAATHFVLNRQYQEALKSMNEFIDCIEHLSTHPGHQRTAALRKKVELLICMSKFQEAIALSETLTKEIPSGHVADIADRFLLAVSKLLKGERDQSQWDALEREARERRITHGACCDFALLLEVMDDSKFTISPADRQLILGVITRTGGRNHP